MWFKFKTYNNNTLGGVLINLLIAVILLLLIAILYFYLYLPAITNHNESITVPNIEGMHVDKLDEFLVKRNLRWEVNDSSYSDDVPPLTVLKQFPQPGSKVKEGRKIYISINRINPPTVPMPNLVDRSVVNAEAVLKSNELKRGKIKRVSGPFLNMVKSMEFEGRPIAEGVRIPKGSVIDLVVMDGGSTKVDTPNVVGHSLEDAKFLIFGASLNLTVTLVGDTTGVDPIVLKQKPESYTISRVGDVIELWVGKRGSVIEEEDPEEEEF